MNKKRERKMIEWVVEVQKKEREKKRRSLCEIRAIREFYLILND